MQTVLLDLDGTLVDSAAVITAHLAAALVEVGAPVPDAAALRRCVGPPFEVALPALGLGPAQAVAATLAYRRSYDPIAASASPLYPDTHRLLRELRAAGFRVAVATAKPHELARAIVCDKRLGTGVEIVGGADPPAGRIGKAAVVGWVLEQLRLDPAVEPVVMVGDRVHDIEGAAAHGVPTIAVTWGYAEPGELAGARLVVSTVAELLTALHTAPVWSTTTPSPAGKPRSRHLLA